jgi:hypothetical protein
MLGANGMTRLLMVLVGLGFLFPATLDAGAVLIANRTTAPITLRIGVGDAAREATIPDGDLLRLVAPGALAVQMPGTDEAVGYSLAADAAYVIYEDAVRGRVLERIGFFHEPLDSEAPTVPTTPINDKPAIVKVKLLVDDEEPYGVAAWEKRLRARLQATSDVLERICGVRLKIEATGTWKSDRRLGSFADAFGEFSTTVSPGKADVAIGFCSQRFQLAEDGGDFGAVGEPFTRHILIREWSVDMSERERLEILLHQLGAWFGAVESPEPGSVMRHRLGDHRANAAAFRITFDLPNALIVNWTAEEFRRREIRDFRRLSPHAKQHLRGIYGMLESLRADDPQLLRNLKLVGPTAIFASPKRYSAMFADGQRVTGDKITDWHDPLLQPRLSGRGLFDPSAPCRWLLDHSLPAPQPLTAYVQFAAGDRFPGDVLGSEPTAGGQSAVIALRPSFAVWLAAGNGVDDRLHLDTRWIDRIVWQAREHRPHKPSTLFLRNGRQVEFRKLHWLESGIEVLTDEGVIRADFLDIAELHLPRPDSWQAYVEQLQRFSSGVEARLLRVETDDGLIVTTPLRALLPGYPGEAQKPDSWRHTVRSAWCIETLILSHQHVRRRIFFDPAEPPLILLEPTVLTTDRKSPIPQQNRSVEGTALFNEGRDFGWGWGVLAPSELALDLPPFARGFRSRVGVDQAAGNGGCSRAAVLLEAPGGRRKIWSSDFLIGSDAWADVGRLNWSRADRLILQVDPAHMGRPEGADPFNIRDFTDWLEPTLLLDRDALRQAVLR